MPSPEDLNDKESKDNLYVGFTWTGQISGICFQDANYNGIYDEGDLPMPGVKVTAIKQTKNEEAAVAISGGTVLIPECYEGLEAVTIDISGGEISIYPADDGLNANGSTGGFGAFGNGMPGFGRDGERTPPEGLEKPAFAEGAMPEPPQGMEPGAPQE